MWFASIVLSAALAGGPSPELQRLATGTFELATTEEAAGATVTAGVEATVASMSWAYRGYVRHRLQKPSQWCPSWSLKVDDEHLEIRCLPHWKNHLSRPWAAPPSVTASDGSHYDVRLDHGEQWISLVFFSEEGHKEHRFSFTEEGMELQVVIDNPHFPVRPRWTLPYTRAAR